MTATTMPMTDARGLNPWWLVLLEGIAALILGLLLLTNTAETVFAVVQFLGFYWLIDGIFRLVSIFIDRRDWGWKLVAGIVGILAGMYVIRNPLWAALAVPETAVFVVGIFGIIMGVIAIFQAFRGAGWGSGILGVLGVLFGLGIMANPLGSAAALAIGLGVLGIVGGIAMIAMAFRMR
jgi:uncharacterized membrane protein HdeD (DUF308 family)